MKRSIRLLGVAAFVLAGLAACEPLEDTWWEKNEFVQTQWKEAHPETGRRPVNLGSCTFSYYPQVGETRRIPFDLPDETLDLIIPGGTYDLMMVSENSFISGTEMFNTAKITIPTSRNDRGERIISINPDTMVYVGRMKDVKVYDDERMTREVLIKRVLKKINFTVTIKDDGEQIKPCTLSISGLATEMKLSNGTFDIEQAVLEQELSKFGRSTEGERFWSTYYRGSSYLLGTNGTNILNVTYTDYYGTIKTAAVNITQYLVNWNTDEVTVNITIGATDDSIHVGKWSAGSSWDYEVDA